MSKTRNIFTLRTSVAAVSAALAVLMIGASANAEDAVIPEAATPQVVAASDTATPEVVAASDTAAPAAASDAAPAAAEPAPAAKAAKPLTPVSSSDPAVADLTNASSSVEIGIGDVSRGSFKFGEYNGLQKKGAFGIGNIDLRGGGAFDSEDTTRWRVGGRDLGLDVREGFLEYGKQGAFQLNLEFDELRHNLSDSFQTPYVGAGTPFLRLPAQWLQPHVSQVSATALNYRVFDPRVSNGSFANAAGVLVAPTAGQLTTMNNIRAADLPLFHEVDLFTKRSTTDVGFAYDFSNEWQLTTSWRHEHRDGLKATAMANDFINGNSSVTLPEAVDTDTEQYNLAMNYVGDHSFGQLAYYGSFFRQHVNATTWYDPNGPTTSYATYAGEPSNQFHQLSLTGGYFFTPATKLVVTGSYGYNTQDAAFLRDVSLPIGLPRNSLDGLVRTKLLDLKLTSRPLPKLNVSLGYKYDERNNETPVSTYAFYDVNGAAGATPSRFNSQLGLAANTLANNINIFDNRPQSKKSDKLDLNADYALNKHNSVAVGYAWEKIERQCEGTWIDCEDARETKEDTLKGEWRSRITDDLTGRLALSESQRRGNYNSNAWLALVPMAQYIPSPIAGSVPTTSVYGYLQQTGLTGWGPILGFPATPLTGNAAIYSPNNNIVPQALYGSRDNVAELPGMRRYTVADRNRDKIRGSLNWTATEKLTLGTGVDFNRDSYSDSVFGLKSASSVAVNFDASYQASETLNTSLFFTWEDLHSKSAGDGYGTNSATANVSGRTTVVGGCYSTVLARNNNAKIDPCNNWSTDERDTVDTLGWTLKKTGLWGDRLDIGADIVYSVAHTNIGVAGGSYSNNPFAAAAATEPGIYFISAADLPRVTTKTLELRLDGEYHINKSSGLHLVYGFKHLKYGDYAYDGMQFGSLTTVMPTQEQAPNYSIHVIAVSYQKKF